ncbi:MAG TPA: hypothetical protein VMR97_07715 [Acidimicrobiales bacterium]|nr:hypothetical protein [Acidimicrobiales bacterium]
MLQPAIGPGAYDTGGYEDFDDVESELYCSSREACALSLSFVVPDSARAALEIAHRSFGRDRRREK